MRTIKIGVCIVAATAGVGLGSFMAGKSAADRYYDAQPSEIANCPPSDTCRWTETNLTTGDCLKNCGDSEPVAKWDGTRFTCPVGFAVVASEEEARNHPETFSAHCAR